MGRRVGFHMSDMAHFPSTCEITDQPSCEPDTTDRVRSRLPPARSEDPGLNAANLPSTVFRAAFAPSPSRLKRSRARRAAAAMSQAKPSLQVVQRADGPFRGHTKSRVYQRRRSEVQMPCVDHQPATGRNSCGSSTPRRIDDFHGQDDNPSPGQLERCEEQSASIQTGLG